MALSTSVRTSCNRSIDGALGPQDLLGVAATATEQLLGTLGRLLVGLFDERASLFLGLGDDRVGLLLGVGEEAFGLLAVCSAAWWSSAASRSARARTVAASVSASARTVSAIFSAERRISDTSWPTRLSASVPVAAGCRPVAGPHAGCAGQQVVDRVAVRGRHLRQERVDLDHVVALVDHAELTALDLVGRQRHNSSVGHLRRVPSPGTRAHRLVWSRSFGPP